MLLLTYSPNLIIDLINSRSSRNDLEKIPTQLIKIIKGTPFSASNSLISAMIGRKPLWARILNSGIKWAIKKRKEKHGMWLLERVKELQPELVPNEVLTADEADNNEFNIEEVTKKVEKVIEKMISNDYHYGKLKITEGSEKVEHGTDWIISDILKFEPLPWYSRVFGFILGYLNFKNEDQICLCNEEENIKITPCHVIMECPLFATERENYTQNFREESDDELSIIRKRLLKINNYQHTKVFISQIIDKLGMNR